MTYIAEMKYKSIFEKVLLAKIRYEDVNVIIISYGYCPAAYLDYQSLVDRLQQTIPVKKIRCHGGRPTYDGTGVPVFVGVNRWIGWDYGHTGDYVGLFAEKGGRKWTTAEIIADVEKVIDKLIERKEK